MKIIPVEPYKSVDPSLKGPSRNKSTPHPFAQVLEETLTENTAISTPSAPSGIRPSIPVSVKGDYQLFDRMEKSLDNLEHYCKFLGDPKVGMHTLAAMTDSLKQDVRDLGRLIDHIETNAEIQPMLRETMVLLTKEIARFEQGGYLE